MRLGQATIEYLFLFLFIVIILTSFSKSATNFFAGTFGNLAHVLSSNLSSGICTEHCFFTDYGNGYKASGQ